MLNYVATHFTHLHSASWVTESQESWNVCVYVFVCVRARTQRFAYTRKQKAVSCL